MTADDTAFDVIIVGAGPVGLSAAIELGRRDIRCLVIERNDRVGYSPRAKTTNVRTREHLRRWGIADALRKASPISPDRPATVLFATRMNGHLLARFDNAMNGSRVRNNLYSEEAQWVPQYILEDVLRQCAQALPCVTIQFNAEFTSVDDDGDKVTVAIRDLTGGAERTVTAHYLIGTDGARSTVRDAIGATMTGQGAYSQNYSVIFRAPDLERRQVHEQALMYWMVNHDVPSLLGPMDESGLWFFMATKLAGDVDPATIDPAELIRRGTGLTDLAIEIVGTDPWVAHRLVADRYAKGRVFLAGDACHLHPPFGGFGMNMGIGDAVDLGWKMAARLTGWGGVNLLESYEQERRKVHIRTIAEAVANFESTSNQLVQPALEDPGPIGEATRREVAEIILATKVREFRTLGIVLGMRYEGSPIVVADGSAPPKDHFMLYLPSAHPGCLAPHLWLHDGSSLYDHFGDGFTLLMTEGKASDADAFQAAAKAQALPLTFLTLPDTRLRGRYGARFALIRPDQHVAWRGDLLPDDAATLIATVIGARTLPAPAPAEKSRAAETA
ncbi:MAG: NAD(P)-binding protein [Rhodopseudomonas sp.]|nr:NAD(P)-binding protein [Rhodopseudomonas sp.]